MNSPRQTAAWVIGILVVLLYALVPVAWMISLSVKPTDKLSDKKFFSGFDFANYEAIFKNDDFTRALLNSLGIAAISTLIAITLAAMAAYALARLDFGGKTVILSGALAVAMFPPVSIVGSLFDVWRSIGLFDTWAGPVSYTHLTLPTTPYV